MKILFAIGLLLIAPVYVYCEMYQPVWEQCESCSWEQCSNSTLQFGVNYSHVNITIPDQSSFEGDLGGIQASYEYRPWDSIYGGLRVAWREGNTENSSASRYLVYVDVQERLGYSFTLPCMDWALTIFSGFGYRYLGHKLEQSGESPINFEYNEFYIPVGFLSEYFLNSWLSIGLNFTWMPQVFPTVEIAPLKGARWIIKNSISNVLVEVPLIFFITQDQCYSLILKPFYEHWKDGHSTAKTSTGNALGLPSNTYNFWGAELNFAFLF